MREIHINKKIKKGLGIALMLCLSLFLVTGCMSGRGAENKTTTPHMTTMPEMPNEGKADEKKLVISTTTSLSDTGLLEKLATLFEAESGIKIDILAQGSGQAMATARAGDADLVLAHSQEEEEKFMTDGIGGKRTSFMHNYFVIVGPTDDPAKIKTAANATSAFKMIHDNNAVFVSRGDNSGTNVKEEILWANSDIKKDERAKRETYLSVGKGMSDTLLFANEKKAYTLTDLATYLTLRDKLPNLEILNSEGEDLLNIYSIILLNSEKFPRRNHIGAQKFYDFLMKDSTKQVIADFGKEKHGQPLFFVGLPESNK